MQAVAAFPIFADVVDRFTREKKTERVTETVATLRRPSYRRLAREIRELMPHATLAKWWILFFRLTLVKIANLFGRASVDVGPWVLEVASTWTFVNGARTELLDNTGFDIDSGSYKEALFLSTSNLAASSTTYAGVTNEVANAVGYTTGGIAVTLTLAGTTTVTVDVSVDPVWTAAGGPITARFVALYEVAGKVLCFSTLDTTPADVSATDGNTLTIQTNASGVFTLN